jgi:hypothetical protein
MAYNAKADWVKVKAEYVQDPTVTQDVLAKKFGVTVSALAWHARREKWIAAREEYSRQTASQLTALALKSNVVALLKDANDKQLKLNEELRFIIHSKLKRRDERTGKIVVREDVSLTEVVRAVAAFSELYRLDRLALGASTENIQPAVARDRFAEFTDEQLDAELERMREKLMPPTIQ